MSRHHVVGVAFQAADLRRGWVEQLEGRLEDCEVVDAWEVDPSSVEVLVVGNPPGASLADFGCVDFIQSTWAGVDRVIEDAPSVPIARMVAPRLTTLMREFVLAAVLMVHRSLPAYRRSQTEEVWRPRSVAAANERPVGVLGFGELGRPCSLALAEFGFDVVAWARRPHRAEIPVLTGRDGWNELLGRSRIVVNLLPLTDETRGILDGTAFARMPRGSSLVNVARGAHVVDSDLIDALDSGQLSDAILDVFAEEPLPPGHPFWRHHRVTVLPHVAAPSDPADLAPHVATNIELFLAGEIPRFLVSG